MNILEVAADKCLGGIDCLIKFGFHPPVDVVAGTNVSFWAARQFGYAIVGLASTNWISKLAMIALGLIDAWITYQTSKNLMKLRQYNAFEKMVSDMISENPFDLGKDGQSLV